MELTTRTVGIGILLVFLVLLGAAAIGLNTSAFGFTNNGLDLTPIDSGLGGGDSGSPWVLEKPSIFSYDLGPFLWFGKFTKVTINSLPPNTDYYIEVMSGGQSIPPLKYKDGNAQAKFVSTVGLFAYKNASTNDQIWFPYSSPETLQKFMNYYHCNADGSFTGYGAAGWISGSSWLGCGAPPSWTEGVVIYGVWNEQGVQVWNGGSWGSGGIWGNYLGWPLWRVQARSGADGSDWFQVGYSCIQSGSDLGPAAGGRCAVTDLVQFRVIVPSTKHVYAAYLTPVGGSSRQASGYWWFSPSYDFTRVHEVKVKTTFQDGTPTRPPLVLCCGWSSDSGKVKFSGGFPYQPISIPTSFGLMYGLQHFKLPLRIEILSNAGVGAIHQEITFGGDSDSYSQLLVMSGSDGIASFYYPERADHQTITTDPSQCGPEARCASFPASPLQFVIADFQPNYAFAYPIVDGSITGMPVNPSRWWDLQNFGNPGGSVGASMITNSIYQLDAPLRGDMAVKWITTTTVGCKDDPSGNWPDCLRSLLKTGGLTDSQIDDLFIHSMLNIFGYGFIHVGSRIDGWTVNHGGFVPNGTFEGFTRGACQETSKLTVQMGAIVGGSCATYGFTWGSGFGSNFGFAYPGLSSGTGGKHELSTHWLYIQPSSIQQWQTGGMVNVLAHGTVYENPGTNWVFANPTDSAPTLKATFSNDWVKRVEVGAPTSVIAAGGLTRAERMSESQQLALLNLGEFYGLIPVSVDLLWILVALPVALFLIIIRPRKIYPR